MKVDKDIVQNVLNRMDTNHDGVVTYAEFLEFYYLLPALPTISSHFDLWTRGAIDIGSLLSFSDLDKDKPLTVLSAMLAGLISRTLIAPISRLTLQI